VPREPRPKIESAALREFASLAGDYCRTIERHADFAGPEFLAKVHILLPNLYAAGLALPDTGILYPAGDDEDDEDADYEITEPNPDRIGHDEWRRLYHSIQSLVGPRNFYREVFDPYEPLSEQEVTGSIADDLVDTISRFTRWIGCVGARREWRCALGVALPV
jgi:Domain of unknown function (DUF5063)